MADHKTPAGPVPSTPAAATGSAAPAPRKRRRWLRAIGWLFLTFVIVLALGAVAVLLGGRAVTRVFRLAERTRATELPEQNGAYASNAAPGGCNRSQAPSVSVGSSQASQRSGGTVIGMRSCMWPTASAALVVMIVQVASHSPAGLFQNSYSPAIASNEPSLG